MSAVEDDDSMDGGEIFEPREPMCETCHIEEWLCPQCPTVNYHWEPHCSRPKCGAERPTLITTLRMEYQHKLADTLFDGQYPLLNLLFQDSRPPELVNGHTPHRPLCEKCVAYFGSRAPPPPASTTASQLPSSSTTAQSSILSSDFSQIPQSLSRKSKTVEHKNKTTGDKWPSHVHAAVRTRDLQQLIADGDSEGLREVLRSKIQTMYDKVEKEKEKERKKESEEREVKELFDPLIRRRLWACLLDCNNKDDPPNFSSVFTPFLTASLTATTANNNNSGGKEMRLRATVRAVRQDCMRCRMHDDYKYQYINTAAINNNQSRTQTTGGKRDMGIGMGMGMDLELGLGGLLDLPLLSNPDHEEEEEGDDEGDGDRSGREKGEETTYRDHLEEILLYYCASRGMTYYKAGLCDILAPILLLNDGPIPGGLNFGVYDQNYENDHRTGTDYINNNKNSNNLSSGGNNSQYNRRVLFPAPKIHYNDHNDHNGNVDSDDDKDKNKDDGDGDGDGDDDGKSYSYSMFYAFADRFLGNAIANRHYDTLKGLCDLFSLLIQYHDPELQRTLHKSPPELYVVEWVTRLFAGVLPLHTTLSLWDILLVDNDPTLPLFIGLALLLHNKDSLSLHRTEGNTSLIRRFAPHDLSTIIPKAFELRAQTPMTFRSSLLNVLTVRASLGVGGGDSAGNVHHRYSEFGSMGCVEVSPFELLSLANNKQDKDDTHKEIPIIILDVRFSCPSSPSPQPSAGECGLGRFAKAVYLSPEEYARGPEKLLLLLGDIQTDCHFCVLGPGDGGRYIQSERNWLRALHGDGSANQDPTMDINDGDDDSGTVGGPRVLALNRDLDPVKGADETTSLNHHPSHDSTTSMDYGTSLFVHMLLRASFRHVSYCKGGYAACHDLLFPNGTEMDAGVVPAKPVQSHPQEKKDVAVSGEINDGIANDDDDDSGGNSGGLSLAEMRDKMIVDHTPSNCLLCRLRQLKRKQQLCVKKQRQERKEVEERQKPSYSAQATAAASSSFAMFSSLGLKSLILSPFTPRTAVTASSSASPSLQDQQLLQRPCCVCLKNMAQKDYTGYLAKRMGPSTTSISTSPDGSANRKETPRAATRGRQSRSSTGLPPREITATKSTAHEK